MTKIQKETWSDKEFAEMLHRQPNKTPSEQDETGFIALASLERWWLASQSRTVLS